MSNQLYILSKDHGKLDVWLFNRDFNTIQHYLALNYKPITAGTRTIYDLLDWVTNQDRPYKKICQSESIEDILFHAATEML
jgi:hypothetical protein